MVVCVLDFAYVMWKPMKLSAGLDDLWISGPGPSVIPPIPGP